MKRVLTFMAAISMLILILQACDGVHPTVNGSGNNESHEYSYAGFSRIVVSSAFIVEVIKSSSFNISITGDDNIFDYIVISKSREVLSIGLKPNHSYNSYTAIARVAMPDLYELELSGGVHGTVKGFDFSHDFDADLSGASSLDIAGIKSGCVNLTVSGASHLSGNITAVGDVRLNMSGAGSVVLAGSADELYAFASGAGHFELNDFQVDDANVSMSGASRGIVNLNGELNVKLSGVAHLDYIGSPRLGDLRISGDSNMSKTSG